MIELKGLTKEFDRLRAVDRLSFRVEKGDIFGFIGPNGAGKTTTLRMLATLTEPTAGDAVVDGYSILDHPMPVRRRLGFMPDHYGVYDGLTIREYLEFFASAYGVYGAPRRRIIQDVMELTDLGPIADRLMQGLSRGMRQRACLAKTLVHDPSCLLLDEPAAGLDPRARIEFRALLQELSSMGKTVLVSSHILTELSGMCGRVAILEKGALVMAGTVEELVRRLQRGMEIVFRLGGRQEEAAALAARHPGVVQTFVDGERMRVVATPDVDIPSLVKVLAVADIPIRGLEESRMNLEDIFLRSTDGSLA